MIAQAANADAIVGGDNVVCDERVLAAAKKVRWVAVMSAGVEECLGKTALERPGVVVTNMRAVAGPVMAEHTIALAYRAVAQPAGVGRPAGDGEGWNRNFAGSQPQALTGKTMLVAGPRRHRARSRAACARARHEGHRHARQLAEGPDYVSYVGSVR